uniref:Uncharacterized protein n=1 Tax=Oryza barthii TaxID=65489 RepID=A0A0D3EL53_9ORYZ
MFGRWFGVRCCGCRHLKIVVFAMRHLKIVRLQPDVREGGGGRAAMAPWPCSAMAAARRCSSVTAHGCRDERRRRQEEMEANPVARHGALGWRGDGQRRAMEEGPLEHGGASLRRRPELVHGRGSMYMAVDPSSSPA